MLVLTRRPDEALAINAGEIIITILSVDGDRVKLGIAAPKHISILRRELCETVRDENRAAALTPDKGGELAALVKELLIKPG
jgi:carbon storage regulator